MICSSTRCIALLILIGISSLAMAPMGSTAVADIAVEAAKPRVGKYERIDFLIRLDHRYENPFDLDEVAVAIRLESPLDKQLIIPAFYCQEYQRRGIAQGGKILDWVYPSDSPSGRPASRWPRLAVTKLGRKSTGAAPSPDRQTRSSVNARLPTGKAFWGSVAATPASWDSRRGSLFLPLGRTWPSSVRASTPPFPRPRRSSASSRQTAQTICASGRAATIGP
jgi:hypothetical protein